MPEPPAQSGCAMDYERALQELGRTRLSGRPVIVASNRGPVEFHEREGLIVPHRGQGGLVTAVSAVAARLPATWVSAPLSAVDQRLALAGTPMTVPSGSGHAPLQVRFVAPEAAEFRGYYDHIANALLWFLQHGVHHAPESPDIDLSTWGSWHAYRQVNQRFADAIIAACQGKAGRPLILLHDYHLYLVPGMLRAALPAATIQHFTHIAWPHPDQWRQLPAEMRHNLIRSLLCCDHLGFNTRRYAEAFTAACTTFLDAEAGPDGWVRYAGHRTRVRGYPVSIDVGNLERFARSEPVRLAEQRLLGDADSRWRIVQVARTDPSKNVLRSFKAIDALLAERPELRGQLVFWGLLPTSRQTCEKYQEYLHRLKRLAASINHRYRQGSWRPIRLYLENDYGRGIAAMKHYDVLLVNSLADGMNLVAKEGPIVNQRAGVLVLSETAGVTEELGPYSLVINPYDVDATAQALWRALCLPLARRQALQDSQRAYLTDHDVFRWAHEQLMDILDHEAQSILAV
ncbi:MAG: trehalose-6-phosphate synthase [Candidatus Sericytochromatia bacterium]|nr:trehalose-6-phosphate synthase [Candidatus Sericytochromatia bacterium]